MSHELIRYLECPACGSPVDVEGDTLACRGCEKRYPVREGVPVMVDLGSLGKHLRGQVEYFDRATMTSPGYGLEEWQRRYVERFTGTFEVPAGALVVDCGAGTGYMSIELALRGCLCIACDLSLESMVRLKKEVASLGLDSRVLPVCCNAEEVPLAVGTADYFISNAVLEHLQREGRAIGEIGRVCRHTAGLMVAVPLSYGHLNPLFVPVNLLHDWRIGHLRRYDERSLAGKLEGWRLVETYYTGHFSKVVKTIGNLPQPLFDTARIEETDARKERKRWGASNMICMFSRGESPVHSVTGATPTL